MRKQSRTQVAFERERSGQLVEVGVVVRLTLNEKATGSSGARERSAWCHWAIALCGSSVAIEDRGDGRLAP